MSIKTLIEKTSIQNHSFLLNELFHLTDPETFTTDLHV